MAYDFQEFNLEDFLRNYKPTYQPAGPSQVEPQQTQPKVERIPAKDQIDDKILEASMNSQVAGQQPQPIQMHSPDQPGYWQGLDYGRQIAYLKGLYETAPSDEQGDATRNFAGTLANMLRAQMDAAGIDSSSFGSNVTVRDTYQNLQSAQARDTLRALEGKYSQSSDDFYQDAYYKNIMAGHSPRQARKFAGIAARQYQAERVAYLDNMYNTYGRDGYVTNDWGVRNLGMLAQENPTLANLYAQFYPNPKDAYARQNQLEDAAINRQNQLGLLQLGHQYGLENMETQFKYNEQFAENNWGRSEKSADKASDRRKSEKFYGSNVDLNKYRAQLEADWQLWQEKQKFLNLTKEETPSEVEQVFNQGLELAKKNGFEGEDANNIAVQYTNQYFENKLYGKGGGKSGSGNQTQEPKLTESQQKAFNQSENLFTNAHDTHSDEDIIAFEEFITEHGTEFNAAYYQRLKDMVLALKGYQLKQRNDDNGATAYWSQVRDVNVLESMYPNENWDYYWQRRGGKPQ